LFVEVHAFCEVDGFWLALLQSLLNCIEQSHAGRATFTKTAMF